MRIERTHSFTMEEITGRLKALTDYWDRKYGIHSEWHENEVWLKGNVKGMSFDGTLSVEQQRLQAEVKVGFLAEKLGGRAYVESKLNDYLDPKISLEALQARAGTTGTDTKDKY